MERKIIGEFFSGGELVRHKKSGVTFKVDCSLPNYNTVGFIHERGEWYETMRQILCPPGHGGHWFPSDDFERIKAERVMTPPRAAYVKVRDLLDRIKGGQAGIAAIDQLIAEEVAAERERCAKIAEDIENGREWDTKTISAAIRRNNSQFASRSRE